MHLYRHDAHPLSTGAELGATPCLPIHARLRNQHREPPEQRFVDRLLAIIGEQRLVISKQGSKFHATAAVTATIASDNSEDKELL
ncbi:hypothetical protein IE4771_PB00158 (plasmid) [Rhizobium etli bv. mimosae str. IE4771]|uniref:Uncharacterized protein n=1 Tax=Rhizobium etli bv. mimosae str. IE4771 TaxID=1432050 RepID=A0A060I806_RHIET|nr:hypothetical protein IE4771_PB00158 [Rhizobium sp. IE4771]